MSGYCRWILLAVLFLMLSAVAVAGAADCPSGCSCLVPTAAREKGYDPCGGQLTACGYDVFQRTMYCYKTPLALTLRTLPPVTLVTPATTQPGTCPDGCTCMLEADAKEKFGTYYRCSATPCYTVVTGSAALNAYCFRQGTPPVTTTPVPSCPQGCTCLSDAQAKERYGTYARCSDTVCGYDIPANAVAAYQVPKYCVKQAATPVCPDGCYCISEAVAKERYGSYTKCSENICGYEQDQTQKFCIKPGTPAPACPEGCSCISEATAQAKGGSWARCSDTVCGYETGTATLAAVVQVPKYCMKQQPETAPACPEGCSCLTDAQAKERYGTFTRCSADVCGYEMSTLTTAAYQIPKYCVKQGTTPVCPDGCACISDEDAKLKGLTDRCDNGQTPCGYRTDTSTTTALRRIPLYCYKLPTTTTTPVCPEGCTCLSEEKAKERYGTFTRCTEQVCGKEVIQPATGAAPYSVPQYCVRQGSTPVCPDGCTCISDEDAKQKGLTERCDSGQTPCGYRTSATTANQRIPLYCYKLPSDTAPVCPPGCYCLQEADAKLKFGTNGYARCQADICGYDQSAASANGIPKYCFSPTVTVTPTTAVCPQGCTCTSDEAAKEKGLTPCRGTRTICGYTDNKQPLYCFEQVPSPTCVYDYQKNSCTGTCPQGYTCGLLASEKDASGKVVYGVCGCTGQTATPCTFDAQKNACTGSCQTGAACTVVGKQVDEKTGAVSVTCGCPPQAACVYDYGKEACAGTCTEPNTACELNTIYRDPASGKVTYADCQCKLTQAACSCDPSTGSCTGTCQAGQACTIVERATDNAGKVVCSKCECRGTCVLTADNECAGTCADQQPCTRVLTKDENGNEKVSCACGSVSQAGTSTAPPGGSRGFFDGISEFFGRLFGRK